MKGWKVAASARRENLLKELSDQYPNIQSFPLDVTKSEMNVSLYLKILLKNLKILKFVYLEQEFMILNQKKNLI